MKYKADELRLELYRRAMREAEALRLACEARKAEREAEKAARKR